MPQPRGPFRVHTRMDSRVVRSCRDRGDFLGGIVYWATIGSELGSQARGEIGIVEMVFGKLVPCQLVAPMALMASTVGCGVFRTMA